MTHNIELQQAAGLVAWNFFEELNQLIKPGLNLLKIEELARKRISEAGMKGAFLGFKGYPAVTCLSVNSAIVHGIPYDYELQDGDVVAVDIGINNKGYLVDTARTYGVGSLSATNQKLLQVTSQALDAVIPLCTVGTAIGDIGAHIQEVVEDAGFAIVEELTGHGVGKTLQEEPSIPNYGKRGRGRKLEENMVIAIEPITAIKPVRAAVLADGWTIVAEPDVATAHFEHTLLVTAKEPVVFTRPI
jgi:methionyl aminopeptidase